MIRLFTFRTSFFISLLFSYSHFGEAKTFRVGGFYSTGVLNLSICTYGMEMSCITKAKIDQARSQGLDISYEPVDVHWSPVDTAIAAKKVVDERLFDAVVGTIVSQEALSASKVLGAGGIPFIAPAGTHPDVTTNNPFALRIPFNDNRQAFLLAKLAAKELKAKKIVVIRNSSNLYSEFIAKEFAKNVRVQNPKIAVVELPILEDFSDFDGLIAKIVAQNADLVFTPLWEPQVASIYSNLAVQDVKITLLASDTIDGRPEFIDLLGKISPKVRFIFSNYWNGKLAGPFAGEYRELHRKYCGKYPISRVSVVAFDAATLVTEALKKGPFKTRGEFVRRMKALKLEGLAGPLVFDDSNDPNKPLELYFIVKKNPTYWKEYR